MKLTNKLKLALIQLDVGANKVKNLLLAKKMIDQAAGHSPNAICLPELFNYIGSFDEPRSVAETTGGPSLSMLAQAAIDSGSYIVGGSILEQMPRGLPKNTCFFFAPSGNIISRYSKMHLFDINIPGKIRYEESMVMRAGDCAAIAATPFGKIGFAICNDLRYPELFRRMALAGARLIFVPSAFTKFTGRDHWLALTRVRAIENQCYIVAVNQSGENADGVKYFGSSVAIDPWGSIICEAPAEGSACIACEIDLGLVDVIRKQLPALKKVRKKIALKIFSKVL